MTVEGEGGEVGPEAELNRAMEALAEVTGMDHNTLVQSLTDAVNSAAQQAEGADCRGFETPAGIVGAILDAATQAEAEKRRWST